MTHDRIVEGERLAVVHEVCACTHTPEWRRANSCSRDRPTVLHYQISRSDVVKQKVTERMDRLASQSRWYAESSAVNRLASVAGRDRRDVTNAATILTVHRLKQRLPDLDVRPKLFLDVSILRWRLRRTHELRKHFNILLDVFAAQDSGIVGAWGVVRHGVETRPESNEPSE